jgi:DNA polymerase-3 subunit beta
MINQVAFAASSDDSRPVLAGVYVLLEGRELTLAAADGFRLAKRTTQLDEPVESATKLIIPARSMMELARALPDDEGEDAEPVSVMVTPNRNQVLFHLSDLDVTSRLVEGNYVDIQRVIPSDWATRTVVATAELQKAVRVASFFAKDSANIMRIQVEPGQDMTPGTLNISATAAEVGDNKTQLDCVVDGEANQIALNVRFLMDALNAIDTPQVALETKTPGSPGVLKPVGEDGHIHVVMPMYLANR